MNTNEVHIGEFACNCSELQALPSRELLVLLVCGDQENYTSKIVKFDPAGGSFETLFSVNTWLLTFYFDSNRNVLLCSTAGGRILEITSGEYKIVADEVPFVSGFRQLGNGQLMAFGWHGLIMEFTSEWRRLNINVKNRIFDLKLYQDQMFICGDAGLVGYLKNDRFISLDVPTNARFRRMCEFSGALYCFSEAPIIAKYKDGELIIEDTTVAPTWDVVEHQQELFVGFGYHGLYRYLDPGVELETERHAFRLASYNTSLAGLAESNAWIRENGEYKSVSFGDEYSELLEKSDLI